MKEELRELYGHRELLYTIAGRDIKVRYKQSVMGFLWAILMPTLIVLAGSSFVMDMLSHRANIWKRRISPA